MSVCSGSMTEKVYKYVIVGGGVSAVSFTASPLPFLSFLPSSSSPSGSSQP